MNASSRHDLAVVVLAGGRSSRFGSDKAAAPIAGQRCIDRIVGNALEVTSLVAVVGGTGDLPPGATARIPDLEAGGGPVQAVVSAFRAFPDKDVLVVACDLPVVSTQHLAFLARELPPKIEARVPTGAEYPMPLSALYGVKCGTKFERCWAAGMRSMRAVLEHIDIEWVGFESLRAEGLDPRFLADFDTPGDLNRILEAASISKS